MSWFKSLFQNNRRIELKQLARKLDMEFQAKDEFGLVKKLGGFQLFKRGDSKKITNLIHKEDGWLHTNSAIFDYSYTVQAGKTSTTHVQTVFYIDSKNLGLPQFHIKPEYFFHSIGKFFNLVQDIEFERDLEFSKSFLIQSEFPEMLKEMISDEMVSFFKIENKWNLEGINYLLIFYQPDKKMKPEEIETFYQKGLQIAEWMYNQE